MKWNTLKENKWKWNKMHLNINQTIYKLIKFTWQSLVAILKTKIACEISNIKLD